jgi:hypothetical protein
METERQSEIERQTNTERKEGEELFILSLVADGNPAILRNHLYRGKCKYETDGEICESIIKKGENYCKFHKTYGNGLKKQERLKLTRSRDNFDVKTLTESDERIETKQLKTSE